MDNETRLERLVMSDSLQIRAVSASQDLLVVTTFNDTFDYRNIQFVSLQKGQRHSCARMLSIYEAFFGYAAAGNHTRNMFARMFI